MAYNKKIEQILNETDIVDIVSDYVQLTKRGRNYIGLCPFHDEKTGSFSVSPEKQICHCFGCKKGGNAFQFLMQIENISFQEAAAKLAKRVNIEFNTQNAPLLSQIDTQEAHMMYAHQVMTEIYHQVLMNYDEGKIAYDYLKMRGFNDQQLKTFQIGYAPNLDTFTVEQLTNNQFDLNEMVQAGLINKDEENFKYYDRFRGRIMFPIKNQQGKVVAFSARTIDNLPNQAKYINSPETPIFIKNQTLYNFSNARTAIKKQNEVIIFEGFMDNISAHIAGVMNGVAIMGTALSSAHINLLSKLTTNMTLLFDGDKAGQQAMLTTGEQLYQQGFNTYVIQLEDNLDPDEYIKKFGEQQFYKYIVDYKQHFLSFKIKYLRSQVSLTNDQAVIAIKNKLLPDIKSVTDLSLRNKLLEKLAQLFELNYQTLLIEIEQVEAVRIQQFTQQQMINVSSHYLKQSQQNLKLSKEQRTELLMLKRFFSDKHIYLEYYHRIANYQFSQPELINIFNQLGEYYAQHDVLIFNQFLNYLSSNLEVELANIIDSLAISPEMQPNEMKDYLNVLLNMKDIKTQLQQLQQNIVIAKSNNDMPTVLKLTTQYMALLNAQKNSR